jgi:hypothetical protein
LIGRGGDPALEPRCWVLGRTEDAPCQGYPGEVGEKALHGSCPRCLVPGCPGALSREREMRYGSRSSSLSRNDAACLSRVPIVARNDPDPGRQLRAEPEDHRQVAASDHDHRLVDESMVVEFWWRILLPQVGVPRCLPEAVPGRSRSAPCISAVQRPLKPCRHLVERSGSCRWHVPPAKGREESLQAQRSRPYASQRCRVPLPPACRADRSRHGPYRPDPRTAAAIQGIEAHFSGHIFHGACDAHGIKHRLTKPCHPSRPS